MRKHRNDIFNPYDISYSVSERKLLIGTLLVIVVGFVIWMPYGPGHPDVEIIGSGNQITVFSNLAIFQC